MIESFKGPSRPMSNQVKVTLPPNLGQTQSLEAMLGENGTCAGCGWTDQTLSNNEYQELPNKKWNEGFPFLGRVASKFPVSRGFRHKSLKQHETTSSYHDLIFLGGE